MNVAIIVEGPDDYETYPVLIRKAHPAVQRIRRAQCGGIRRLRTKFVGFLEQFQNNPAWAIDKALVIRDSDCAEPGPLEQELRNVLQQRMLQLNFPARFYATKCKLETLLLADEDAISQVALRRGGEGRVERVNFPLESYNDSDQLLPRVLWKAGRLPATPQTYAEIADAANLQLIAERCPYFRHFIQKVQAC